MRQHVKYLQGPVLLKTNAVFSYSRNNNNNKRCSRLAQKESKTRYDWVEKLIHLELCKKFKFDNTDKWLINKAEFVSENETHKTDSEIQMNHLALMKELSSSERIRSSGP